MPYDPIKEFAPIIQMTKRGAMLLVRPGLKINSLKAFLAYAKANPGKINFGTSGNGGVFHIVAAWLQNGTRSKFTFVHYKGAGPMNQGLVAGRLDAIPGLPFVVGPHIKSGKMIPIASLSETRDPNFPDIPTVAELAIPGFDYSSYSGFVAAAGTPRSIIEVWNRALLKVSHDPKVVKIMEDQGAFMAGSTPEEFGKKIDKEYHLWHKVIRENGIPLKKL